MSETPQPPSSASTNDGKQQQNALSLSDFQAVIHKMFY
ncbi:MAG TPA: nucleotide pyrophosphohydrolase, partial [Planctomycetaceae bacterium]|nr:nucleotide pyrophosphohydrolase [Planctomycetaceae bacterium]